MTENLAVDDDCHLMLELCQIALSFTSFNLLW